MSRKMRSVLILYVMCISCVIHVENGALMYRTDFMDAHNNNKNKEWAESDYAGQLFVQNNRDVHLVARKTANKNNRHFFGRIIIPYIICFFAAKGFWPFFPTILQYQVNEMGRKVFSLSDDRIRQFCRGKFDFQDACFRPMIFRGLFIPLGAAHDFDSFNCTFASVLPPVVTAKTAAPPPTTKRPPSTTTAVTIPREVETIKPPANCNCTTAPAAGGDKNQDGIEDFGDDRPPGNVNIEIKNIFAFGSSGKAKNHTVHGDEKH